MSNQRDKIFSVHLVNETTGQTKLIGHVNAHSLDSANETLAKISDFKKPMKLVATEIEVKTFGEVYYDSERFFWEKWSFDL